MIPIHFSHANGFPASSYACFLAQLQPHPVYANEVYGRELQTRIRSWRPLAAELISEIEAAGPTPVIGLGHSLGAVFTLWAAEARPDLFTQIILLDPPLFGWKKRLGAALLQQLGLAHRLIPIVRNAGRRKDYFPSREAAAAYWREKRLFRDFHPQCFADYVAHALVPEGKGFRLLIPPRMEQQLFATTPFRIGTRTLKVPATYVYAAQGGVLQPQEVVEHKRRWPQMKFVPYEGGHMFPLEAPEAVAQLMKEVIYREAKLI